MVGVKRRSRVILQVRMRGIHPRNPAESPSPLKCTSHLGFSLGTSRDWTPLPVGRPNTNPIVALAQARRLIEDLQPRAARVDGLEAELVLLRAEVALLRNGSAIGHSGVTDGESGPLSAPHGDSYETAVPDDDRDSHGAIGHSEVTNGPPGNPPEVASHSYESADSGSPQGNHGAIGHSEVTNGLDEGQEYLARRARVETLCRRSAKMSAQVFSENVTRLCRDGIR